jgi:hypothetical protein
VDGGNSGGVAPSALRNRVLRKPHLHTGAQGSRQRAVPFARPGRGLPCWLSQRLPRPILYRGGLQRPIERVRITVGALRPGSCTRPPFGSTSPTCVYVRKSVRM